MRRRVCGRVFKAGLLAGAAYAIWRWYRSTAPGDDDRGAWEPQPFPYPPVPRVHDATGNGAHHVHVPADVTPGGGPEIEESAEPSAEESHHVHVPVEVTPGGGPETDATPTTTPWMDPVDGACPLSHPVKAKLASGIYHVPGSALYDRTKPDRCYLDAAAAESDGLRPPKR